MPKVSFLGFQYGLPKRNFLRKPSRLFSKDGQNSSKLPAYQQSLEETKQVFDKYDANKDGKISPEEYKAILKALGKGNPLTVEVKKIFEVADLDGDGFIDFKEFVEVQKKEGGLKTADLQNVFRTFEMDGDGKITVEGVFELLQKLRERCSMKDCRRMVRAVDANGDGVIDMDEFMTMMTRPLKRTSY